MKIGDYVKVKDGIELDSGELSKDWAGKVVELNGEYVTIKKDAQTLNSLSDDYIKYGIVEEVAEYIYVFEANDLELSERRDNDEMYQEVVLKHNARIEKLDDDYYVEQLDAMSDEDFVEQFGDEEEIKEGYFVGMEEVTKRFLASPFFQKIIDTDTSDSEFIIDMFVRYSMNYRDEMIDDWTEHTIDEICLDILPRKVSMEAVFFKKIGEVLKHYFDFLYTNGFIKNRKLGSYVYKKRDTIYKNSQDPRYWGMAKSMLMGASDQGIEIDDEASLRRYLDSQMGVPQSFNEPNYEPQRPIRKDASKKIGRNQKVTVKYNNGKVMKDVKYKKVMKDVQSGTCEVIDF